MQNVKELNDLKLRLSGLLEECKELAPFSSRVKAEVPQADPIVIVLRGKKLLATYRRTKPDKAIEAVRVTVTDCNDGPTAKRFDMYLNRLARFLEKRGMYQHREVITDETPELFND